MRITNDSSTTTASIVMRTDDFAAEGSPFGMFQSFGAPVNVSQLSIFAELQPTEEIAFSVNFEPKAVGRFSAMVPIFVRGEMDDGMFNKLVIIGERGGCCLRTDVEQVTFPPVKLEQQVTRKINVRASYFQQPTNLTYRIMEPEKNCGVSWFLLLCLYKMLKVFKFSVLRMYNILCHYRVQAQDCLRVKFPAGKSIPTGS